MTVALADGSDAELRAQTALLGPHLRWVDAAEVEHDAAWSASLSLPGPHNARNASIARAVLSALGIAEADDDERLAEAASGFAGLPSRCHSLGRIGSVEFVDDSLSTNVLPAQAALHGIRDPARRLARRRPRPWRRLCATRDDPRRAHVADSGRHDARQRTAHRRRGARGGGRRASRSSTHRASRAPSKPRSRGRRRMTARVASCCSRPPHQASDASRTFAPAPPPSPRPRRACGSLR